MLTGKHRVGGGFCYLLWGLIALLGAVVCGFCAGKFKRNFMN